MNRSITRPLVLIAVFAITAVSIYGRKRFEHIPPAQPLDELPLLLGGWEGDRLTISESELQVLGPGEFLARRYLHPQVSAPISLLIAYFPSQRTGDTLHSPKHCLPGAGWMFASSSRVEFTGPGFQPIHASEYVLQQGDRKALAVYWYQAHGRSVASEYAAKFYLVSDAIRMHRTDGALIRVITPVQGNETVQQAHNRAVDFINNLAPHIDSHIPL